MSADDHYLREAQLRLLEDAACAEPGSPSFDELMKALRLPLRNRDELMCVLLTLRWRRSRQPFEYLRRRVLALAVRSGREDIWNHRKFTAIVVEPGADFSDAISALDASLDYDNFYGAPMSLFEKIRPEFRSIDPQSRVTSVRWDAVQRALRLSRLERRALALMLDGVELDDALASRKRTSSREALARAWVSLEGRKSELRALLFGPN